MAVVAPSELGFDDDIAKMGLRYQVDTEVPRADLPLRVGQSEAKDAVEFVDVSLEPRRKVGILRRPDCPATIKLAAAAKIIVVVCPAKADTFSGSQSRQGKSQSLVARMAGRRETKSLKPIDKAIFGMAASHRAVAKQTRCGPENYLSPEVEPTTTWRRQHGGS